MHFSENVGIVTRFFQNAGISQCTRFYRFLFLIGRNNTGIFFSDSRLFTRRITIETENIVHMRPVGILSGKQSSPCRSTVLLSMSIGKNHALCSKFIDIGCLMVLRSVTHSGYRRRNIVPAQVIGK
ncbi:hypothetical protein SDC9_182449 [bioreactor metagenome]|uniref:Uncharacterized protein n=1 Tax=bioreactor metagenome TaxID=1076179 RepID=A0A645H7H3_9ZZZZ